jgi:hypothetical protein
MPDQDRTQESNPESLLQEVDRLESLLQKVDRLMFELQQRTEVAHQFDEFFRALWEATKGKKPAEERELFRRIAQEVYGGNEIVDPEAIRGALGRAMKKLKGEEAQ